MRRGGARGARLPAHAPGNAGARHFDAAPLLRAGSGPPLEAGPRAIRRPVAREGRRRVAHNPPHAQSTGGGRRSARPLVAAARLGSACPGAEQGLSALAGEIRLRGLSDAIGAPRGSLSRWAGLERFLQSLGGEGRARLKLSAWMAGPRPGESDTVRGLSGISQPLKVPCPASCRRPVDPPKQNAKQNPRQKREGSDEENRGHHQALQAG